MKKKSLFVNIIRCICAVFVVFSHSFSIGMHKLDYLGSYSNDVINFGAVAVAILFAISGYYIMKSIKEKGLNGFIKKRVLRIIPSLFLIVVFSVIILGVFFSSLSIGSYFTNKEMYKYLLNIIFIPIHNLPGVFENNVFGPTVNGALWTMMVQFCCYIYIFVYMLFAQKIYKKFDSYNIYLIISLLMVTSGYILVKILDLSIIFAMIRPVVCFIFGGYLYKYKNIKKSNFVIALALILLCVLINNCLSLNLMLMFLVPIVILYLMKNIVISVKNRVVNYLSNCSYEIYLVGFPIQQSITSLYNGSMNVFLNFALSMLIILPVAVVIKYLSDKIIKIAKI